MGPEKGSESNFKM